MASLHPMERRVLALVASGMSLRTVARQLGFRSQNSVRHWLRKARRHMAEKLSDP